MKQKIILMICLWLICFTYLPAQKNTGTEQTYFPKGSLSLRTNLIPWMILTPGLGAEYKPADNIGILVDGAFAHWDWDDDNRHHRLWVVNPQVRYYTGNLKGSYIGVEGKIGQYNFKWSAGESQGQQGSFLGGGLTFGHQFDFGKNLLVDLGLSVGYLYLYDKEDYIRMDNTDYRTGEKTDNGYWGPTGANITFVWKIN